MYTVFLDHLDQSMLEPQNQKFVTQMQLLTSQVEKSEGAEYAFLEDHTSQTIKFDDTVVLSSLSLQQLELPTKFVRSC